MRAELTAPLKGTLLALAYYENKEGAWVWPAIETLAGCSGLNRKTVIRSLAELIKLGLVERQSRVGTSSQYRLAAQPIFGLAQFRVNPNSDHGVAHKRADTQPILGPLINPGDLSKNKSTPASPPPFAGEASRLLEAMTAESKPSHDDTQLLKLASQGDRKAWDRFRCSCEGQTKRFLKGIA